MPVARDGKGAPLCGLFQSLTALVESAAMLAERDALTESVRPVLVYGGEESQTRSGVDVVPWRRVGDVDWSA